MLCKNCKNEVRAVDVWYLFPNTNFKERKLYLGKCSKCANSVILLSEVRKSDDKLFIQLEIGKKADKVAEIHLNQIDYTREDLEIKKGKPCGYVYGKAKKDIKNKRYNIYRVDFNQQEELIGYLDFNDTKIKEIKQK